MSHLGNMDKFSIEYDYMCIYVCTCVLSHVWLFATPWTVNHVNSSAHGIFQARILEWPAICFSRGFSQPETRTHISYISCIGKQILYPWAPGKPKMGLSLGFLRSMTSVPDHSLALVSWAARGRAATPGNHRRVCENSKLASLSGVCPTVCQAHHRVRLFIPSF